MSILSELADQIRKSEVRSISTSKPAVVRVLPQPQPGVVKSGPGGVIFDFGPSSGHWYVDRYNALLQGSAENSQLSIAKAQKAEIDQALGKFVELGEQKFQRLAGESSSGISNHEGWNDQLSKSTDQLVVEAFNKGALENGHPKASEAPAGSTPTNQEFSKSNLQIQGETVAATSETDAALIEMMKSGGMQFE